MTSTRSFRLIIVSSSTITIQVTGGVIVVSEGQWRSFISEGNLFDGVIWAAFRRTGSSGGGGLVVGMAGVGVAGWSINPKMNSFSLSWAMIQITLFLALDCH